MTSIPETLSVAQLVHLLTAIDIPVSAPVFRDGDGCTSEALGIDFADGAVIVSGGLATRRPSGGPAAAPSRDAPRVLRLNRAEVAADLENCVSGVGEVLRDRIMALLDELDMSTR